MLKRIFEKMYNLEIYEKDLLKLVKVKRGLLKMQPDTQEKLIIELYEQVNIIGLYLDDVAKLRSMTPQLSYFQMKVENEY